MPPPWVDLAEAYGGVAKLAEELGVSGMHLNRLSKGRVQQLREPLRRVIAQAAEAKGLPNPVEVFMPPEAPPIDPSTLTILELFGGSSSMDAATPETIARMKEMVSDDQLIALTEQAEEKPESVSANVLRAAAFLLEV